jgi:HK97 gp10 family phage protein
MTLTGMDGLLRALREIPDVAREELKHAVTTTAFAIAQRMRATAPRDSGLLLRNISASTRGLTGRVEIGVDAFYWPYVEFGTVRMPARPFIRPSAELESGAFEGRLREIARTIEHAFERSAR